MSPVWQDRHMDGPHRPATDPSEGHETQQTSSRSHTRLFVDQCFHLRARAPLIKLVWVLYGLITLGN